ncbi:MAG: aminopeptidase [Candidatus Nanoarchaeia archaeon]|nr:aminopeptidase [Candidatus Nanoarchaeia archaeon]
MQIDKKILKSIIEKILDLKEDESFLILTDNTKKELAMQIYNYAKKITTKSRIEVIKELEMNGQEPEQYVAELMLDYDVQFYLTSKSLSHTNARRNATKKGHRIISAPGLTKEIIERCVDIDYGWLIDFHEKLRPIILNSKKIHITTKNGTDITTAVHDTRGKSEEIIKDMPGAFGNLPAGEIDSGIIREKTNGIIVFDGSFPGLGILKNSVKVKVIKGKGEIIIDNENAKKMKEMLSSAGEKAFLLAELGIGTNPKATITGNILEDEKALGTVHFAFGNDLSYNGKNDVPLHLDGIIRNPTIKVDGRTIMKDGKFLV